MKFRVERDVLAEAVTWTARTLPVRPPVPVLSGVRITAVADGTLTLSTFDYDVSARSQVAADVEEPGEVLVSGRLLADISRALPARPIEMTIEGTKVQVTCGSSRFTLATMPVDEYPTLPDMPAHAGSIPVDAFSRAVAQVSIAAGRDETLPLLTGVKLEIRGDKLTFMATDRYRLALREISWAPVNPQIEREALVRARTLTDVAKSLTSAGNVELSLSEGSDIIGFEAGGRHSTSVLVDGDYPPVRRLFPDQTSIHTVTNTAALIEAAKRVALVAERNTPIRLTFSEGQVVLEAGQGDDAQASEALESTLVGEEISTAFNPTYLLEGLAALGTDFVRLSFTQASKPVVMTGQDSLDSEDHFDEFRYLLMPIRFAS
ncbi:DNA polymerase III subunit beta [Pseudactinotalea sp. HY158]|uniref:DNA polymerase III subunit beta n=1 Tax=unclassified Pseudactinotalea TaxID=2649176 RepID=UPI00129C3A1F|nr:DNA polymerase III subunit beta [Pseudactinotalea sp. HY158]MPV51429.1 DNA polymerase III subunit beta [Pseudactinotalea sp. HY160]QGH68092.1 DNA polymerase III subunit beta [Pseudactinotalea sp. HY158]